MRKLIQKLEFGLEEFILAFLIIIEVMDFFTIIPAPIEYIEKVVAVVAMCYLFYKASLTKIIFGKKEKKYDILIVTAYLLLSIKTVIGFIISAVAEESMMREFYSIIVANANIIEKMGFWIGCVVLLMVSGFLIREKIKRPCIMAIIHEENLAKTASKKLLRFVSIYLVLLAIFVTVFTFALEWLGLTIDAPVLMIVLFFYLFVIVKRGKSMKTETFLNKVSESSEGFYSRFISLFHSRKTIATAIGGLLVLHLIVDIGHFIIPYTTGLLYPWYFEQLGAGHVPLSILMAHDFSLAKGWLMQIGVMLVYVLNVLAILMLFFGPAYAWFYFYRKKRVVLLNIIWLFFGSLAAFILLPVFKIGEIKTQFLVGTDITTQQISSIGNIGMVLLISVLVAGICYILEKTHPRKMNKIGFAVVYAYFGFYLYYFFIDLAKYYTDAVVLIAQGGQYFIALHLMMFFVITIMFYIGGYIMFLHESYIRQKI